MDTLRSLPGLTSVSSQSVSRRFVSVTVRSVVSFRFRCGTRLVLVSTRSIYISVYGVCGTGYGLGSINLVYLHELYESYMVRLCSIYRYDICMHDIICVCFLCCIYVRMYHVYVYNQIVKWKIVVYMINVEGLVTCCACHDVGTFNVKVCLVYA